MRRAKDATIARVYPDGTSPRKIANYAGHGRLRPIADLAPGHDFSKDKTYIALSEDMTALTMEFVKALVIHAGVREHAMKHVIPDNSQTSRNIYVSRAVKHPDFEKFYQYCADLHFEHFADIPDTKEGNLKALKDDIDHMPSGKDRASLRAKYLQIKWPAKMPAKADEPEDKPQNGDPAIAKVEALLSGRKD